jgi:hypothetical protein
MKKLQLEALNLEVPKLSPEMCKRLLGGGYGEVNGGELDPVVCVSEPRDPRDSMDNTQHLDHQQDAESDPGQHVDSPIPDYPQEECPNKVEDGKCIHGVIAEAVDRLGGTPDAGKIEQALKPYEVKDKDGNIIGLSIHHKDLERVLGQFLEVERATNPNDLKNAVEQGCLAFAEVNNGEHAVLIIDIDRERGEFICYDPVFGGDGSRYEFGEITLPFIVHGVK